MVRTKDMSDAWNLSRTLLHTCVGDFWDRRGDLPVIPLNNIQQEMASWQDTPLLMLPGNHDQVRVLLEHFGQLRYRASAHTHT